MRASCNWGATGATLYYTVTSRVDGSTVQARTASGVSEVGTTGVYEVDTALAVYPNRITWDDGTDCAIEDCGVDGQVVSLAAVADLLRKAKSNRWVVSGEAAVLYDDDDTTVIWVQPLSEDAGVVTRGKAV